MFRTIAAPIVVALFIAAALSNASGGNTYPSGFQGFMPLPENKHYFQYKGLPYMCVKGGNPWGGVPMCANSIAPGPGTRFNCNEVARGDAASQTALQAVQSESQYSTMAKEAKVALAEDRMYAITFFHKNWCLGTTSDELIKRAIKYTWSLPNVTYSFIYEGDTKDSWIASFKELGKQANPATPHMFFSVQNGTPVSGIDFLLAEGHESGIQWGFPKDISSSYLSAHQYPLVRDAVVQCLCFKDRTCLSVGQSGCTAASASSATAATMRKQILQSVHSGTPYGNNGIDGSYQNYSLQMRWYVENMKTFENEPGDELVDSKLPKYVSSGRPSLKDASGYTHGARTANERAEFAVIYSDPDGDAPALSEVWVDRDADGRFSVNPSKGERIQMKASGTDYKGGVTFTAGGIAGTYSGTKTLKYVFRFADKNWYPPTPGGATPTTSSAASYSKAPAYSYSSWTLAGVSGGGSVTAAQSQQLGGKIGIRGLFTEAEIALTSGDIVSTQAFLISPDGKQVALDFGTGISMESQIRKNTMRGGLYIVQLCGSRSTIHKKLIIIQ